MRRAGIQQDAKATAASSIPFPMTSFSEQKLPVPKLGLPLLARQSARLRRGTIRLMSVSRRCGRENGQVQGERSSTALLYAREGFGVRGLAGCVCSSSR